jgi:hypothetical protein
MPNLHRQLEIIQIDNNHQNLNKPANQSQSFEAFNRSKVAEYDSRARFGNPAINV